MKEKKLKRFIFLTIILEILISNSFSAFFSTTIIAKADEIKSINIKKENILDDKSPEKDESYTVFNENEKLFKDSVVPKEVARVEGGTDLLVEVKLHYKEKANVFFNGKKYPLIQIDTKEFLTGRQTKYSKFRAFVHIDKSKYTKSLGNFYIELEDKTQRANGGEIIVIGEEDKISEHLVVDNYSAKLYDGKNTSYVPLEYMGSIPKDTIVRATNKVKIDKKEYYILESGYRVRIEDLKSIEENDLFNTMKEKNEIKSIEILESEKYSTIKIKEDYKGEYDLITSCNIYKDEKNSDFNVEVPILNSVYIRFVNGKINSKIKENLKIDKESIFEDMKKSGENEIKLGLKNKYYGHYGFYDKDGYLNIRFRKKIIDIKNSTIVIDPGHGMNKLGFLDSGALGFSKINEHDLNRMIAKSVSKHLKKLGANVILLNTTKKAYSLQDRPREAYINDADMFISIHNNSGGGGKLNATEDYYYTSFSKKLALEINKELTKTYENCLFNGIEGDYNRGAKWDYYTVILEKHCPSVLIEVGYVDNKKSFEKLTNEYYREKLSKSIVKGIENYVKNTY